MKAKDIMREVITPGWLDVHSSWTVDCLKIGDPECEVKKIATTLTATPDVIKAVGEWGADLLIVHEPTFYNHVDEFDGGSRLCVMKRELIEKYGLTIYRYHDAQHMAGVDLVNLDFSVGIHNYGIRANSIKNFITMCFSIAYREGNCSNISCKTS